MKDLTTNLETRLAQTISRFRSKQEEADEILRAALSKFAEDVTEAHAEFELAAGLRVEGATAAMASQIRMFLGTGTEPEPVALSPATTLEEAMDNARAQ